MAVMRRALLVVPLFACGNDRAPTDPVEPEIPRLTLSPPVLDFGDSDFTSASIEIQGFTLANVSDDDVALTDFVVAGTDIGDFTIVNEGCPETLGPAATCGITLQFQATAREQRTATLEVSAVNTAASAEMIGRGVSPTGLFVLPGALNFGDLGAGTIGDPIELTVFNELEDTAIAASIVGSSAFQIADTTCSGTIPLHGTCTVSIEMAPAHGGEFVADLEVAGAAQTTRAGLTGRSTSPLSASPFTRMFGSMLLGETGDIEVVTIKNTTAATSGTLAAGLIGAAVADFTITGSTCTTLDPEATCTVSVQLTPQTRGAKIAQLEVTDGTSNLATRATLRADAYSLFLSGTPSFPDTTVGQTSTKTFKILNASSSATGAITTDLTGSSELSITSNNCAAGIPPNNFCEIVIELAPITAGAKSATLEVTSSPGGSDTLVIDGSGV